MPYSFLPELVATSSHTENEALRVVAEAARRQVGARKAALSLAQEVSLALPSPEDPAVTFGALDPEGTALMGAPGRKLLEQSQGPVRLSRRGSRELNASADAGWLAAPLVGASGALLGVLELAEKDSGDFEASDEEKLADFARMAVAAIESHVSAEAGRAARAALDTVLEGNSDAFFVLDRDWRLTCVNVTAGALFEKPRDELLGRGVWCALPDAAASVFQSRLEEAVRSGRPSTFTDYYPPREVWLRVKAHPHAAGLSVHAADVTEEIALQAELSRLDASLRAEAKRVQRLAEVSPDLIATLDVQGRIIDINQAAQTVLGYDPAEMIGRRIHDFIHQDERTSARTNFIKLNADGSWSAGPRRHVHKNGAVIHVQWAAASSREEPLIYAIGRNVTERLELEDQLRHAQRLEAMGQLTGGVAHDFNNLLTVILGSAEILETELADNPDLGPLAEVTRVAAERGAELTSRLLSFARRQGLEPQRVDVERLYGGMEALLQSALGDGVQLSLTADLRVRPVEADPIQLQAAILNLALNGRDAMDGQGALVIAAKDISVSKGDVPCVEPGRYVMLSVTDSGCGMTPELVARALEPFFTTKEPGRGSGLGLSMVYGFARQSGGALHIDSEPGSGTTVRLYLPIWTETAGLTEAPASTQELLAGVDPSRRHVLLVEDDGLVRAHAHRMLTELGYRVTEAANASEALDIFAGDDCIDLMFSDILMPGGMNGRELAVEVRRAAPDLPILLTSGYDSGAADEEDGGGVLKKPYRRADLATALANALAPA